VSTRAREKRTILDNLVGVLSRRPGLSRGVRFDRRGGKHPIEERELTGSRYDLVGLIARG
jgi:hypothetical protein